LFKAKQEEFETALELQKRLNQADLSLADREASK
jgi:hypothetical protein